MLTWLKQKLWLVVVWLRPPPKVPPHDKAEKLSPGVQPSKPWPRSAPPDLEPQPISIPPPSLEVGWTQPVPPEQHPQANRSVRRRLNALERARRRHDKFVTPQGTPPVHKHHERAPSVPAPEPAPPVVPEPEIPSAELLISDTHFAGGDEDVLYKEAEFYGEYNFRDTILDQLERYFVYLRRMKKNAPDVYALYRQVGAILIPYCSIMPDWACGRAEDEKRKPLTKMPELSPWFKKNRPAFGCFAYGSNPVAEQRELEASEKERQKKSGKWIIVPKFMYFHKYSQAPPEVQPMSGGDIYSMSIWWDRPHDPDFKSKKAGPTEYAVFVSADGKRMEILRMCKTKMIEIMAKKKNRGQYFQIPQRCWQIPKTFRDWADDYHEDVQIHLGDIFANAMKHYEDSQYSMLRVAARKDNMTAVFSVNVRRMAYFFKDRDFVLNENGARRPVFHMVRAHERHTTKGTHAVKFHFRGEREFTWAGYQVSVTVPGRDHFMLSEFDVGVTDEYWIQKGEKTLGMKELGQKINSWIDEGVGGHHA
jgi:hypothetical protein